MPFRSVKVSAFVRITFFVRVMQANETRRWIAARAIHNSPSREGT